MGSVMIGDFGNKDGVQTYRICGAKEDIYKIIEEARDMGHKFFETPVINRVYRSQWSVLLKLKISVGVSSNGYHSDFNTDDKNTG